MTKTQRIARLQAAYCHEAKALRSCVGNQFATADEQRKAVSSILSSIASQLRRLGVEMR